MKHNLLHPEIRNMRLSKVRSLDQSSLSGVELRCEPSSVSYLMAALLMFWTISL